MKDHKEIRQDRAKQYGDFHHNHTNIGEVFHALLQSYWQRELPPLPSHIACLMMSSYKHIRAAIPFSFNEDDYDDARNYMDFAREGNKLLLERDNDDNCRSDDNAPWDGSPIGETGTATYPLGDPIIQADQSYTSCPTPGEPTEFKERIGFTQKDEEEGFHL